MNWLDNMFYFGKLYKDPLWSVIFAFFFNLRHFVHPNHLRPNSSGYEIKPLVKTWQQCRKFFLCQMSQVSWYQKATHKHD